MAWVLVQVELNKLGERFSVVPHAVWDRRGDWTMSPVERGHVTLSVQERALEIRTLGFLDRAEQLNPFYLVCGRLFDLVSPRLP